MWKFLKNCLINNKLLSYVDFFTIVKPVQCFICCRKMLLQSIRQGWERERDHKKSILSIGKACLETHKIQNTVHSFIYF